MSDGWSSSRCRKAVEHVLPLTQACCDQLSWFTRTEGFLGFEVFRAKPRMIQGKPGQWTTSTSESSSRKLSSDHESRKVTYSRCSS